MTNTQPRASTASTNDNGSNRNDYYQQAHALSTYTPHTLSTEDGRAAAEGEGPRLAANAPACVLLLRSAIGMRVLGDAARTPPGDAARVPIAADAVVVVALVGRAALGDGARSPDAACVVAAAAAEADGVRVAAALGDGARRPMGDAVTRETVGRGDGACRAIKRQRIRPNQENPR